MASPSVACAILAAASCLVVGCSSPLDGPARGPRSGLGPVPSGVASVPASAYRVDAGDTSDGAPELGAEPTPDEYMRYALYHSPEVEAAYQRWRAAAERLGQVGALPDPRVSVGFFLDEVETRTGAQQARLGLQQALPWPGLLEGRKDAASRAAIGVWRGFEAARLAVTERVVSALHDLAYLDAAVGITRDNLELLRSFEDVLRARYRVGEGSHPELIRAQVELGQLEDRVAQLRAMRPVYVAELNAAMNRAEQTPVPEVRSLPGQVVSADAATLAEIARRANPELLALDERAEEQRRLEDVARAEGRPELTVGLDYTLTQDAANSAMAESGDDPIMLTFGVRVPLWREKYEAGVRESVARRLSIASEREGRANSIGAAVHRAWFEHTDADRRVRLYERTLIPTARDSLRSSLAGFRAGETSFLDLLDTERTLLEFAVAAERARADRGKALARLSVLVGEPVQTEPAADGPGERTGENTTEEVPS